MNERTPRKMNDPIAKPVDEGTRYDDQHSLGNCISYACCTFFSTIAKCFGALFLCVAKYIFLQICLIGGVVAMFIIWIMINQESKTMLGPIGDNVAPIIQKSLNMSTPVI